MSSNRLTAAPHRSQYFCPEITESSRTHPLRIHIGLTSVLPLPLFPLNPGEVKFFRPAIVEGGASGSNQGFPGFRGIDKTMGLENNADCFRNSRRISKGLHSPGKLKRKIFCVRKSAENGKIKSKVSAIKLCSPVYLNFYSLRSNYRRQYHLLGC